MGLFIKKYCLIILALCFCIGLINSSVLGQSPNKFNKEAVIEVKNFSIAKTLPEINEIIKEHSGFIIQSFCPGQDLVVFSYDPQKISLPSDIANILEDKGLIAYLKEGMTSIDVSLNCKTKFTRINNQIK